MVAVIWDLLNGIVTFLLGVGTGLWLGQFLRERKVSR